MSRWTAPVWTAPVMLAGLLLLLLACGGKKATKGPEFPDRKELAQIAATPVKAKPKPKVARVERWSPVDTEAATNSPEQRAYRQLLQGALSRNAGKGVKARVVASLHCLAGYVGRFVLKHGAQPGERLRRFMAGRCGAWFSKPKAIVFQESFPASMSRQQIFAKVKPHLEEGFSGVAHMPVAAGIWAGREGDRFTVVVGLGHQAAHLRVVRRGPRLFRVHGRLRQPAAMVRALMTAGAHDTAECQVLPGDKLPAFSFECQLPKGDQRAWLALMARQPKRLLGGSFAEILLHDGSPEALEYDLTGDRKAPASTPQQLRHSILAAVNRTRRAAGLRPVKLAIKQSRWNDKLAAHFFSAGDDAASKADRIALGLMAGWDVPGTIRDGSFIAVLLDDSHDAEEWLAYCMERPFAREQLMAAQSSLIAIGGTIDRPYPGLGVLAASYSFFDLTSKQQQQLLTAALQDQRRQHGQGPAVIVQDPAVQAQAKRIRPGKYEAKQALGAAMAAVQKRTGKPTRGAIILGNDLATQVFPKELLDETAPRVHFGITHLKPPKSPWGVYVILVVLSGEDAPAKTARRKPTQMPTIGQLPARF